MSGEKIKLGKKDGEALKESVQALKSKFKLSTCRQCGDPITFMPGEEGKVIPFDTEPVQPHWKSCPYSGFTQKKTAKDITKKFAVFFAVKFGADFEKLVGLTKKETQVVHAILEKAFKESSEEEGPSEEAATPDDEGLTFHPEPADPIGDPDEERAPSESLIGEVAPSEPVRHVFQDEMETKLGVIAQEVESERGSDV